MTRNHLLMSQVTATEREELARRWVFDGASINELADEFDRTTKTVSSNIRKFLDVDSLRDIDRTEYEQLFDEPDDEPDDGTQQPAQEPEPSSSARLSGGQHMAPPRPEHYFDTDDTADVVEPFDVFKSVVEMFPNYGSNVNDEQTKKYLVDRAEYIGTAPTPGQLSDWLADAPGVSDNTASAVKEHYVEALDGQVQQGNLTPGDIKEVYAPGSTNQQPQQPQQSSSRTSEAERRLRRTAGQSQQQPSPSGESQTEERLMQYATQDGQQDDVPQHVEKRLDQADLDPGVRQAMREMYMLGKEEQTDGGQERTQDQSRREQERDRQRRGRNEPSRDELKDHIRMLEARMEQDDGGSEFTDFLDQLTKIESQLDQLRGNDGPDESMQRLEERIEGLYRQMDSGGNEQSSAGDGIANVIASAPGMEPGEKAQVLQSLQGATADPEVKKEEIRLQRHEAWANSIVQAAEKAAEGMASGSNVVGGLANLANGGQQQQAEPAEAGEQQAEPVETEPQPSPQAKEYGGREEPTEGAELERAEDDDEPGDDSDE